MGFHRAYSIRPYKPFLRGLRQYEQLIWDFIGRIPYALTSPFLRRPAVLGRPLLVGRPRPVRAAYLGFHRAYSIRPYKPILRRPAVLGRPLLVGRPRQYAQHLLLLGYPSEVGITFG